MEVLEHKAYKRMTLYF